MPFYLLAVCAASGDDHVFGLSMCCRMLQQKLRALAVVCLPNEISQDGHYHYHTLLPTLPCLANLLQAGNGCRINSYQQVIHKKKVTMVSAF